MPMCEDKLWTDIGRRLDELMVLLQQVDDASAHALQAQHIINNVRACKEEWQGMGKLRGAGRPQAVFLQQGNEADFCQNLKQLLTEHLQPSGKALNLDNVGAMKCSDFFALLYDVCVQAEVALGCDDLLAYYNLIQPVAREVIGAGFTMAYKTLAARVNKWGDYVTYQQERVFLHRISQHDVVTRALRQALGSEKFMQQTVANFARKYGLIPDVSDGRKESSPTFSGDKKGK